MRIRYYQKNDYLKVASLLKKSNLFDEVWDSEENLSGMIDRDAESIIVAEAGNEVVGNIFIIPYGTKISYLFRLAVKSEFRKLGIATELIKRAQEIALNRGVTETGLYVESNNVELQSFYEKRGFKKSKKTYFYMWSKTQ